MRKIPYTMLYRPCWDNIAQEHCLVIVAQVRLRQYYTRKLLVQCWTRAYRHTFTGKPVVSNMSDSLFFNQVQYHWTILALFFQCWLGSSFTACGTTMNRGRLWLEQLQLTVCIYHLLTHHDIHHFNRYFGNDQQTKKKVCPNETLSWAYLIWLVSFSFMWTISFHLSNVWMRSLWCFNFLQL